MSEEVVQTSAPGIDIVDYDFKGGIRVKTNRMFLGSSEKPVSSSRSVTTSSGLTFSNQPQRNLSQQNVSIRD